MVKEAHLRELTQSDFLRDELIRAKAIYETFVHHRGDSERQSSTRLVPGADSAVLRVGAPV
jgi:hypothetical protein